MKTIIKNKRNYRTKIGRPCNYENRDLADQKLYSSGSQQAASGIASDAGDPEELSNSDENNGESSAEEDDPSASSAGTKRKATGSGGNGEKGKQRKK
jgi:hypothetical protein